MSRLLVHVEGPTEETFVNEVLARHLVKLGYERVSARIVGNARQRADRGGIRGWKEVKRDIVRHLAEDQGCKATTMVDYYGLPQSGEKAWPGRAQAGGLPFQQRASTVELAIQTDVLQQMGDGFNKDRFVPFVVMHEFEGLLFSNCEAFAKGLGRSALAGSLQEIRDQFETPEEINDSPNTAPSKRIVQLIPEYQKPLYGNIAALEIGLDSIQGACPHFQQWVQRLEALANK